MIKLNDFGIIIEARTGSQRLHKKILKKIAKDLTIFEFLLKKIKKQKIIKKIVVATTLKKEDDIICKICSKLNVDYFRGSENNLINRVSETAKFYSIKHIIQITSDNLFFEKSIFKKLIKIYQTGKYDFASNSLKKTFPLGSDIRIFSLKKLIENKNEVKGKNKQHTCHFFLTKLNRIKYFNLEAKKNYYRPNYRLTLDYPEDLKLYKIIVRKLGKNVNLRTIIKFLDKNPDLVNINSLKKSPYYWIKS